MEHDPHQLIEGMILAAYALECQHAYIYIRGEFYHGARDPRTRRSRRPTRRASSARTSSARASTSTSRSTAAPAPTSAARRPALIESLEGKRGQPRIKPPFPAVVGRLRLPDGRQQRRDALLRRRTSSTAAPTGSRRSAATRRTPGPKLYCVSGPRRDRPGVYEAADGHPVQGAHLRRRLRRR